MRKFLMKLMLLFLTLFTFHFVLLTSPAFAQASDIGKSRITPASPLYFLKSVQEIWQLKFAETAAEKDHFKLKFLTRRVAEVNSLAGTGREDLIEPTLEKFWFQFRQLQSLTNLKDWVTAKQVSYEMMAYMDNLQSIFPQVSNQRAKRSIRLAVHRISEWEGSFMGQVILFGQPVFTQDIKSSRLSACNFLSQEASSSALNGTEEAVLSQRAQKCFTGLDSGRIE